MQAYQLGMQKFRETGSQVLGVSTDSIDTLKSWASELKLEFPLLSDKDGKVAQTYGVLMPGKNLAFRTTFVVDRDGRIASIEEGTTAIDITGAHQACSRLGHAKPK